MKTINDEFITNQFYNESKLLVDPGSDRSQRAVDFGGRAAQNEVAEGPLGNLDVLEGAHDVDLRVGEHDARFRHVLNGVLGAPVFSGDAADCAGEVVTLQRLHVGHLKQDEIWRH